MLLSTNRVNFARLVGSSHAESSRDGLKARHFVNTPFFGFLVGRSRFLLFFIFLLCASVTVLFPRFSLFYFCWRVGIGCSIKRFHGGWGRAVARLAWCAAMNCPREDDGDGNECQDGHSAHALAASHREKIREFSHAWQPNFQYFSANVALLSQ